MAEAQPPWVKNPSRSTRRRGGRAPSADDSSETRVAATAPAEAPPQSPLDFTLAVMRDPLKPDALRASLAKAALPYVHGRWCPLGSDPRDAKPKLSPSVEAHEDSLIRHARHPGPAFGRPGHDAYSAGHPRLSFLGEEDVDGTQLGFARVASDQTAASRVNPTCGVKPGHDENKEGASVLEQRALAAEERMREMEQRAIAAEAALRETDRRAVAAETRMHETEQGALATETILARVKTQWPDIFDASGAVRAPAASEREALAQLVAAQERARDLEERAIMAEGALREAQFRARDMEQRACAAEELIAWRR